MTSSRLFSLIIIYLLLSLKYRFEELIMKYLIPNKQNKQAIEVLTYLLK